MRLARFSEPSDTFLASVGISSIRVLHGEWKYLLYALGYALALSAFRFLGPVRPGAGFPDWWPPKYCAEELAIFDVRVLPYPHGNLTSTVTTIRDIRIGQSVLHPLQLAR